MKEMQWHEPAAYRRAIYYENERNSPLSSLKFAGTAFLAVLGFRLLAGLGPDSHAPPWPPSFAVAAGVALTAAYGLPALMSLMPGSIVILSDKGVNNNVHTGRGWSIRFWSWDEIESYSLTIDTAGGKSYDVFHLHDGRGEVLVTLALKNQGSMSEVQGYFAAHGKRLA